MAELRRALVILCPTPTFIGRGERQVAVEANQANGFEYPSAYLGKGRESKRLFSYGHAPTEGVRVFESYNARVLICP